jgi:type II secretory pathway pseudopilin PulG
MRKNHSMRNKNKSDGAVLLEVVLALVLIAAAAAVVGAGLSASIDRVDRLRLNAHAADMAVSVISELQMGSKLLSEDGPEFFEAPFEEWTWEAQAEGADEKVRDTGRTKKVEVIIRHEDPPVVHRLCQVIRFPETEEDVLLDLGF